MNVQTKSHIAKTVALSNIHLNFGNSRRRIDPDILNNLKASITELGLLQPLVVAVEENGGYCLVAGFTRYQALIELGHQDASVTIIEGDAHTLLESHIAENTNRQDLSFVSSIDAIKRLATQLGGDYAEVGKRLGYSKKVMDDRLALTKCSKTVLDSLDEGLIKVGHAVLLSGFSHGLQDKTLSKVIDEKWSVEHLRERATKAQIPFTVAKFDQSECKTCVYNSDYTAQSELFGETIKKGLCSNTKCFGNKQAVWLNVQREVLTERHGVLLDLSAIDLKCIHVLNVTNLGDTQYNACQTCQHNVTAIDDRLISKTVGTVRAQLCNNQTCYGEKAAVLNAPKAEEKTPKAATSTQGKTKKTPTTESVSAILTNKQKEVAEGMLATFIRDSFPMNEKTVLAVAYLGISSLCSKRAGGALKLSDIVGKSNKEVSVLLEVMLAEFFGKADKDTSMQDRSPRGVLHDLLCHLGNPVENIVQAWSSSTLTYYPTRQIVFLCEESGFAAHYDLTHGQKAFDKLQKSTKPVFLKAIEDHDFSWEKYAPAAYLSHFSNKLPTVKKD